MPFPNVLVLCEMFRGSRGSAKSQTLSVSSKITTQICTSNVDTRNLTKQQKTKNLKEKQLYIFYQLDNGKDYTKSVHMCVCV